MQPALIDRNPKWRLGTGRVRGRSRAQLALGAPEWRAERTFLPSLPDRECLPGPHPHGSELEHCVRQPVRRVSRKGLHGWVGCIKEFGQQLDPCCVRVQPKKLWSRRLRSKNQIILHTPLPKCADKVTSKISHGVCINDLVPCRLYFLAK